MAALNMVIKVKVKYGDVLRRFNVGITGDEVDMDMNSIMRILKQEMSSLFSFPSAGELVELVITHVNEDGDDVTVNYMALTPSGSRQPAYRIPIHNSFVCKYCGENPIIGPRFRSIAYGEYDLCGYCFYKVGNDIRGYIKLETTDAD